MNKKLNVIIKTVIVIVALIGLDQWTKNLAVKYLANQTPIVLIDGVFELNYTTNKGAAFGILQNHQIMFAILTIAVVIFLAVIFLKIPQKKKYMPLNICIAVLIAGAIGNLIDRLSLGYVVDFLYFKLINFPIFNVADIYVTCSAVVLLFVMLFVYKEEDLNFHV
jgi:signal peptidase II